MKTLDIQYEHSLLISDSLLGKVLYIKNIGCIGNIGSVIQYSDIYFVIYVFPEEKSK